VREVLDDMDDRSKQFRLDGRSEQHERQRSNGLPADGENEAPL
jgi:hypothetical protein